MLMFMYINIQVHPSRCTCIKLLDFLQVQNKNKIFKKNKKALELLVQEPLC